ncbi:MAG: substrate-binding domain-containing protein [Alphaproteobacteria bacterium]|nr:substrate-binding domain-containing protein [Alphaproteobacteria bacterium]
MATASRVMNQPELVRPPLRQRVIDAAKELRYVPNPAARALARRRTMRIGAVIPTVDNTIFARFVESITRRLRVDGYGLLVSFDEFDPALEASEIRALVAAGVDGMILVGERRDPELFALLESTRIPHVVTNIVTAAPGRFCVGDDNRGGAELVTRYLLDLGHRVIGVIDAPASLNDRAALRIESVRSTMTARGLSLPPQAVVERHYSVAAGRQGLRAVLSAHPDATAIVCGNDILAIGAIVEARAIGLRVPEDLSITGFDGLDLAAQMEIGLTTVSVSTADMGLKSAETLLGLIAGRAVPSVTVVPHELVVRASTARPRVGPLPVRV